MCYLALWSYAVCFCADCHNVCTLLAATRLLALISCLEEASWGLAAGADYQRPLSSTPIPPSTNYPPHYRFMSHYIKLITVWAHGRLLALISCRAAARGDSLFITFAPSLLWGPTLSLASKLLLLLP
jgi:hypothetical protein